MFVKTGQHLRVQSLISCKWSFCGGTSVCGDIGGGGGACGGTEHCNPLYVDIPLADW